MRVIKVGGGCLNGKKTIEGIVDLVVEPQVEKPYIEIEVDLAKAEKHGIKPGDVRRAASTLLTGIQAGSLFEEQKVFDVVVWGTPETRHSVTSVRELLIATPGGDHVRLQDVADVRVASALAAINREDISRRIDVNFGVRGRTRAAVARDIESALGRISFPRESHADLLGDYAQRQAVRWRILIAAIVALIGIFLLLQAAVGSWRLAGLILVIVPSMLSIYEDVRLWISQRAGQPVPEPPDNFQVIGPLARSVDDLTLLLSVIQGPDGIDPGALPLTRGAPADGAVDPHVTGYRRLLEAIPEHHVGVDAFGPAPLDDERLGMGELGQLPPSAASAELLQCDLGLRQARGRFRPSRLALELRQIADDLLPGRHQLAVQDP